MHGKDRERRNHKRHIRIHRILTRLASGPVSLLFNYSSDNAGADGIDGPVIVVPNHACAWDPVLTTIAFRNRQMYFVASEHILRWKVLGPLIGWMMAPIPRRKAGTAAGTVMTCLRHLRAGHSIVIYAEGEQTWTGISGKVFPATGKLAKQSGATLVTFRTEGAYLALPRWASGIRRGKIYGHTVNIYTPEMLGNMTADEVNQAIDRDISFDIWKWQDMQPGGRIPFTGRGRKGGRAAGLDKALFICPQCTRTGTLTASGDEIKCGCGFRARFSETGFFEGDAPGIDTIADWDEWQTSEFIRQLDALRAEVSAGAADADRELFSDTGAVLLRVEDGHRDEQIAEGRLGMRFSEGRFIISVGAEEMDVSEARLMAMVLSNILLIQTDGGYYQIQTGNVNLRKYLQVWEYLNTSGSGR